MGLMPPVSNSPTLQGDYDILMKDAQELIARKDKLEQELRELEDVLISAGVGMDTPLVDNAGFPRSEIDVHTIRTSRNMIHRLRNDHRDIMSEIEATLHRIHQLKKASDEAGTTTSAPTSTSSTSSTNATTSDSIGNISDATRSDERPIPFAVVNAVAPDSPAYNSGLRRNDQVVQFGGIHAGNHSRLQALNTLISHSENQTLTLSVLRDGISLQMLIRPRSGWGGRGTLGCHLLPL
ncbi:mitogen activated protein kinase 2 [Mucor velutinosus]|uniref:Probable 26S proteasome regulatory subunit p27 n=1 Tax=Mucor velutinosus TaxID=708070 RepID=A0AAN7I3A4_9FUNG|nr:mitogen activated protein kinase 2 [Mucor velutinosus]